MSDRCLSYEILKGMLPGRQCMFKAQHDGDCLFGAAKPLEEHSGALESKQRKYGCSGKEEAEPYRYCVMKLNHLGNCQFEKQERPLARTAEGYWEPCLSSLPIVFRRLQCILGQNHKGSCQFPEERMESPRDLVFDEPESTPLHQACLNWKKAAMAAQQQITDLKAEICQLEQERDDYQKEIDKAWARVEWIDAAKAEERIHSLLFEQGKLLKKLEAVERDAYIPEVAQIAFEALKHDRNNIRAILIQEVRNLAANKYENIDGRELENTLEWVAQHLENFDKAMAND